MDRSDRDRTASGERDEIGAEHTVPATTTVRSHRGDLFERSEDPATAIQPEKRPAIAWAVNTIGSMTSNAAPVDAGGIKVAPLELCEDQRNHPCEVVEATLHDPLARGEAH